jgi:hypothetical protein
LGSTKVESNQPRAAAFLWRFYRSPAQRDAEIARLRAQLAVAAKNSSTSSKPPSSDIVKKPKDKPKHGRKRQRGGQGRAAQELVARPRWTAVAGGWRGSVIADGTSRQRFVVPRSWLGLRSGPRQFLRQGRAGFCTLEAFD